MKTLGEHLKNAINSSISEDEIKAIYDISKDGDIKPLDGAPTFEKVNSLLPTLKARLKNATQKKIKIIGIENLVKNLSLIDCDAVITGYPYISDIYAANIYYNKENIIGVNVAFR